MPSVRYIDPEHTAVEVTLAAEEAMGAQVGPVVFQPGMEVGNIEFDALMALIEADAVTVAPYTPPPEGVPAAISDRQFAQALALAGTITEAEALAWAARGELPQALEDALDHIPDTDGQRFGARMMLAAATTYERHLPLTEQLGALLTNPATGMPYDANALDALWTRAAAL